MMFDFGVTLPAIRPDLLEIIQPSDWLLGIFAILVLVFAFDYGLFSPWWKHPIGYVVLLHSLNIVALMFLIFWAFFTGERLTEWARQLVGVLLILGIIGKIVILHMSRMEGRRERRARREARHAAPAGPKTDSLMLDSHPRITDGTNDRKEDR